MEIKEVKKLKQFRRNKVVRKVPMMTEHLMTAVLFIGPDTEMPILHHKNLEKIHYIVEGEGKLSVGKETRKVAAGMLILIPKAKMYYYKTFGKPLVVLSIGPISENGDFLLNKLNAENKASEVKINLEK